MATLDIAVLILYFFGISLAGVYFSKRNTTTEAYFLGNRNFPAWAIGLSLIGTSISSISFLAYPGDGFKTAWLRLVPGLVLPIAIIIASIYVLPFFRSRNYATAFEYLELRFGAGARIYGALAFCVAQLMRVGFILFLVSLLIQQFTGWNIYVCIVVSGVFVSFYTIMGGFEAVVWTDVVQTIVLLFGGAICLYIVVDQLSDAGGLSLIFKEAGEAGKFKLSEWDVEKGIAAKTSWGFTFSKKTALMMIIVGMINWMYEFSCNQNVVQRYCASRTIEDARRSMWICCIGSIPIWVFFMFLGSALWVYYNHFPATEAAQMLSGELKADQILPFFILTQLPAGIAGLVIAAVMAAAMSSLDSSINAISTVLVTDIVKRHTHKDREDAFYLKMAHKIAIVTSIVMIIGAGVFYNMGGKSAQDTYSMLVALTAGGLLSIYMIGFFTKTGDGRSILIAIAFTFIFSLYRVLEPLAVIPDLPIDSYYTGIVGNIIMFGIGMLLGKLLPAKQNDLTGLTVWTKGTEEVK